jgi:DMSO/TMAO reductase YedYZ molybdopterin-dependent catalytic subunit
MSTPDLSLAQKIADKTRRMCEDGRFSFDELQLAFRNRGMPIEALRYEFTPSGLHYLLSHFDICDIDVRRWRLELCGTVGRPVSLSLDDLKKITQTTMPVTLECAGNGRAFTHPRAVAQPWIREAVSTALWTGVSLSTVLRSVGVDNATRDVVFWGADMGPSADTSTLLHEVFPWTLH